MKSSTILFALIMIPGCFHASRADTIGDARILYSELRERYQTPENPLPPAELERIGDYHQASFWKNVFGSQTYMRVTQRNLAPLHKAVHVIEEDIKAIQKMLRRLDSMEDPRAENLSASLSAYVKLLKGYRRVIVSGKQYSKESLALEKLRLEDEKVSLMTVQTAADVERLRLERERAKNAL